MGYMTSDDHCYYWHMTYALLLLAPTVMTDRCTLLQRLRTVGTGWPIYYIHVANMGAAFIQRESGERYAQTT
jgi:hypothetical protein